VQGEISTNIGRIDAVWELPGITVVAEVKYSADRPLDKVLDEAAGQIRDRKYYESYLADGKQIIFLSIAFSGKEIGCRMETNV
jgi:hypothetical protein